MRGGGRHPPRTETRTTLDSRTLRRFRMLGCLGLLIFAPVIVIEIKSVDKIAEQRQPFFAGLFFRLIGWSRIFRGYAFFLVKWYAGLVEHMLFHIDRHIGAHRQRNRITWPRIDLDRMAALFDDNARVESAVVNIADKDMDDCCAKLAENGFQQVVRHGALWLMALERERDRIGFEWTDPDRQVAPAIGFAQDDDTMLRQQAHANAVNSYTDHLYRPFGGKRASIG
jgi:hypothetical protein